MFYGDEGSNANRFPQSMLGEGELYDIEEDYGWSYSSENVGKFGRRFLFPLLPRHIARGLKGAISGTYSLKKLVLVSGRLLFFGGCTDFAYVLLIMLYRLTSFKECND